MSRRGVTAPRDTGTSPGQQTLDVLQKRLVSAEGDARELSTQLAQIGFDSQKQPHVKSSKDQKNVRFSKQRKAAEHGDGYDPITPFKAHVPDAEVLYKNYDSLVGRVCHMESTIQGLKLVMTRAQAERDLTTKEKVAAEEKLLQTTDAFDKEVSWLNRELAQGRKQAESSAVWQKEAETTMKRLQHALEEASSSQSAVNLDVGGLRSAKSKLERRVHELRGELSRESSLRLSLEESHSTLLSRVQQMELVIHTEREEVTKLSENCKQLKHESIDARAGSQQEQDLRVQSEKQLLTFQSELDCRQKRIISLEEDKRLMMNEMKRLQKQYMELNSQIDNMTHLVSEKQSTYKQLESENKHLFEAMKSSASQNAELISKYEQELESGLLEKAVKIQTEENMKQIEDHLRTETRHKVKAEKKCVDLESSVAELTSQLNQQEKEAVTITTDLNQEIAVLSEKLSLIRQENDRVLHDKETLLDEVNQAVDSMTEERGELEEQLQQLRVDLQNTEQRHTHAEAQNYQLLQRLAALEDHQSSQKHVEQTMTDMMEQKNKLAYDKGRLQSKVEQLQGELESLANAQTDLTQVRRTNAAMEAKITKLQSELSGSTSAVQRLDTQLRQSRGSGDRKEKDFEMAIKARDEAVKEAYVLHQQIEKLMDREKQRASSFEQSLCEVREDNKKMAATLESVIQSHAKLQLTIEGLQIDLGRKDNVITQLKQEKGIESQRCQQLLRESDQLHNQVVSLGEVSSLRSAFEESQADNKQLAKNMESLIESNSQLQAAGEALRDQLTQKTHIIESLQESREQSGSQHQKDMKLYQERLENIKQQLTKERDKSLKKSSKETSEVRKQLDDVLGKNGDLSRTNTDLRHRLSEVEHQTKDQKEKMTSMKSQVEHLQKMRTKHEQTIDNLQGLGKQLSDLEKAKNDYMKKTKEQSKTIQLFMSQIGDLQTEIKSLAQTQLDMSALVQRQDSELHHQKHNTDQLRKKYKESQKREQHLDHLRQQTEDKLNEANDESLQISANLQDAHEWFKSKFDNLQHELSSAKRTQVDLEREKHETRHLLAEEKTMGEVTAQRAKDMIKTSRETISRLADYAEVAQYNTQDQLERIHKQLIDERSRAEESEKKLHQFQDASLRHTEELAKELDYLKTHSWILAESS